jgi:hypothetical protein
MKCESCGCAGKREGEACFSCGKGGPARVPDETEIKRERGGGSPRHYKAFK